MKTRNAIKLTATVISGVLTIWGGQAAAADKEAQTSAKPAISSEMSAYELIRQGGKLSPEQVAGLEQKLSQNPDDVNTITMLLGCWFLKSHTDNTIKQKREKYITWLIKNHPEAPVLGLPNGQLMPSNPLNTEEREPIKKLWIEQVGQNPDNLQILWNAGKSMFFIDPELFEQYFKKGQSLAPNDPKWSQELGLFYSIGIDRNLDKALKEFNIAQAGAKAQSPEMIAKGLSNFKKWHATTKKSNPEQALEEYKKAYALTKAKDTLLPYMAKAAFDAGKNEDAREYSLEMLRQAEKIGKKNWNYGNLIFNGNDYLGKIALKQGNIAEAQAYMLESGKTPGSPQLNSFGPDLTLAGDLLAQNQKDAVLQFLKDCSKFWKYNGTCDQLIQKIENGETPDLSKPGIMRLNMEKPKK